ncbi:oxygen-dependent protoporphyrinogen oxidase [Coemansia thaxteri]|uniref:Protoporphyrinogen oxidase n=1 Tax=Coemansia thaxteri TaxID=2663907 RepID=A0A9W8EGW5_9FUNG|nr:oxygen-dependent protoporphyrinogen oxidase [Coemansia thaxteri]KAJ2008676.1 oxygen-dependent protoporphyrinogen oxidase [Coemansia thaxteri]KAJ2472460.1 oxygen-dependent protoporphyrinogen oxidase [Coemansia sp. RSA 2322]KAJ2488002.1 oxygen-dependent protoporphyrinogen oxidase [Coemansia sp. RSA 2320]
MAAIAVLGGGISGLSTAWYLAQRLPRSVSVAVIEGSERLGGWVRTERRQAGGAEILAEKGPRTLRAGATREALAVLELVDDLDLRDSVVTAARTSAAALNRFIYYDGSLNRMPSGVTSLLGGLPAAARCLPRGIWRDLTTRNAADGSDESVHDFIARRFGAAVDDNLASAVMHGIYAADSRDLSARALLYPFWLADRTGSTGVLRGLRRVARLSRARSAVHALRDAEERLDQAQRRSRNPAFWDAVDAASMYSFQGGMQTLTDRLAAALRATPNVELITAQPAVAVRAPSPACAEITLAGGRTVRADHVISALPLPSLAPLLGAAPSALAGATPYASVAVVNVAYASRRVTPVDGFGYLVPRASAAQSKALGVVFDSRALPPQDRGADVERLTVMLGGSRFAELFGEPSSSSLAAIEDAALLTLRDHLRITQSPADVSVTVAPHCIPSYTVGYIDRLADMHAWVAQQLAGRLSVVGAAFGGPAVPQCVLHARDLVLRNLRLDDLSAPQHVTGLEEIIKGFAL